jgi:amino acid permease
MGILILLIGILLVGLISIETLMFYYNLFDSLNKSSELYFVLKNIQYVQPYLIFFALVLYFFLTPIERFTNGGKFNHNYDEPKMLGSKKFRKIVRIFIFIQFILIGIKIFIFTFTKHY